MTVSRYLWGTGAIRYARRDHLCRPVSRAGLRLTRTVIPQEENTEGEGPMTTNSRGLTEPTASLPVGSDGQVVYVREPRHWGRRLLVLVGTLGVLVALFFG